MTDQLEALHSTTLAAIMCDAFPELEEIQERPFEVVSAENKLVPCKRVPPVGLEAWKPWAKVAPQKEDALGGVSPVSQWNRVNHLIQKVLYLPPGIINLPLK